MFCGHNLAIMVNYLHQIFIFLAEIYFYVCLHRQLILYLPIFLVEFKKIRGKEAIFEIIFINHSLDS